MDTVVVSSRNSLSKTKKGLLRSSSGTVTYSSTHRLKVDLDAQEIAYILGDGVPGGGHAWTPSRLAVEFKTRTGRPGVWMHYDIGLSSFLLLFPKTFEVFGPANEFVRLVRKNCRTLLDNVEDAMVRLAMGREDGRIHYNIADSASQDPEDKWVKHMNDLSFASASPKAHILPRLTTHRLKAAYIKSNDSAVAPERTSRSDALGFGNL